MVGAYHVGIQKPATTVSVSGAAPAEPVLTSGSGPGWSVLHSGGLIHNPGLTNRNRLAFISEGSVESPSDLKASLNAIDRA